MWSIKTNNILDTLRVVGVRDEYGLTIRSWPLFVVIVRFDTRPITIHSSLPLFLLVYPQSNIRQPSLQFSATTNSDLRTKKTDGRQADRREINLLLISY